MIIILFLCTIVAAILYFKKECQLTKKEKKELQKWRDEFKNKY